jgi:hypothetical protein
MNEFDITGKGLTALPILLLHALAATCGKEKTFPNALTSVFKSTSLNSGFLSKG